MDVEGRACTAKGNGRDFLDVVRTGGWESSSEIGVSYITRQCIVAARAFVSALLAGVAHPRLARTETLAPLAFCCSGKESLLKPWGDTGSSSHRRGLEDPAQRNYNVESSGLWRDVAGWWGPEGTSWGAVSGRMMKRFDAFEGWCGGERKGRKIGVWSERSLGEKKGGGYGEMDIQCTLLGID